jgi:hypothetical protein
MECMTYGGAGGAGRITIWSQKDHNRAPNICELPIMSCLEVEPSACLRICVSATLSGAASKVRDA